VRLTHAIDASFGLPPSPSRESLRWIWGLTSTDLQRDTRIIAKDEVVAGFGQAMWLEEQGGPLDLFIFVDPDHRTNGIGTSLLSWGGRLARELGAEGVRAEVPEGDIGGHELLRARGFAQVRSGFTMSKTLRGWRGCPAATRRREDPAIRRRRRASALRGA
jgi:GNAT superfamily N-acetyltransferase